MSAFDARAADDLNRFLDEMHGSEPPGFARRRLDIDPGLSRAARYVHSVDDAPGADPAFVERLLDDILQGPARIGEHSQARRLGATLQTRWPASARTDTSPGRRWPRWAAAQLATAALLLLTLVSSLYVFGPGRYRPAEDAPRLVVTGSPMPAGDDEIATVVWESRGDPEQPLDNPGHMTIDPDGNLWIVDSRRHGFQILSPDGVFLEHWGTSGAGPGEFALEVHQSPAGAAAFDADGNLYVADAGNQRVQKFGPDRSFLLSWGTNGRGDGEFLAPDHVAIDGVGNIFVLDGERDDIQVFDPQGNHLRTLGRYGAGAGQFMFFVTGGMAIDRTGSLWVADTSNQRIQQLSDVGEPLATIGEDGPTGASFASPNGVAVDDAGHVFVVDAPTSGTRVQVFSPSGDYLGGWPEAGGRATDLSTMTSLLLDGAGHLYVVDYDDDRVLKLQLLPPFDSAGTLDVPKATPSPAVAEAELVWQTTGDDDQPFDHPAALAIDPGGNIWVADTFNHGYQILSPDGEHRESWGVHGSAPGELTFPPEGESAAQIMDTMAVGGIAFAPDGSFYVADTGNARVQKFGPDRAFIFAWGSEGTDDGQFMMPVDVAVDAEGRVYVADARRNDVQVFTADGAYLRTIGRYGFEDGQFYLHGGAHVTLDGDGNLWVADTTNKRLQNVSSEGVHLATVGGPGTMPGRFSWPGQIAIDAEGRLFVTDGTGRRIQVFDPDGTILATVAGDELGDERLHASHDDMAHALWH